MATHEKKPDSPIVLMLDIETLSLRPTAMVTQIGYCIGDIRTRTFLGGPTSIWMKPQPFGDIDQGTIDFWCKQDPAVAKGVFDGSGMLPEGTSVADLIAHWREGKAYGLTVEQAFSTLSDIVGLYEGITVYGSPGMFDLPILTHMFDGRKPWKYNYERDMMTIYKIVDPFGLYAPKDNLKAHDAAADAEWQMQYLFTLMHRVNERLACGPKEGLPSMPVAR